ncbi:MAG: ATP-binding cassette domain-containing protein [Bacteroidales bacterium]|nr:ATP-binding cassette domain-containing protein [Bacteroidales bacterium]
MPQNQGNGFVTSNALPLVQLEGVDIVNEDNLILTDVSFKVSRGELVYLVGKVGSGKSSILKTLDAELPVKKGKARVGDYDLKTIKNRQIPLLRRNLGVVFQDFQLLSDRTVEDNLMFVLNATGWEDQKKMQERCSQVLDMVDLKTKAHKMPHQLSGGEQQRVAIARALLNNPDVVLADEPTGNLDAETADGIMTLMMKIHHQYKPAIIIVTHNRTIIDRYPGRVLLCSEGRLREVTDELSSSKIDAADDMPA